MMVTVVPDIVATDASVLVYETVPPLFVVAARVKVGSPKFFVIEPSEIVGTVNS